MSSEASTRPRYDAASMEPLERLLNLVGLLLETTTPLTYEQIRSAMPEAYGQSDPESAKRMFERDKEALRHYDIPLEMHDIDAWGSEQGYRIPKDKYYLPVIAFTPEELAALYVAAQSGGDDRTAERAVRKLLYGVDGGVLAGLPRSALAAGTDAAGAVLEASADAADRHRRVRFSYRTAKGEIGERDVDAFGMVCRGGRWYLVGLDHDRDAVRAFRLSRITKGPVDGGDGSAPPEGFRAAEHIQGPWGTSQSKETATIAFSPSVAWWATSEIVGAETAARRDDEWVEVSIPMWDLSDLAGWALQFGPDAEVLGPPTLRDEVVRRLESIDAG